MEEKNKPINPISDLNEHPSLLFGLTKREYFAAMAMQGLISDQTYLRPNKSVEICQRAIEIADELLKQLNP